MSNLKLMKTFKFTEYPKYYSGICFQGSKFDILNNKSNILRLKRTLKFHTFLISLEYSLCRILILHNDVIFFAQTFFKSCTMRYNQISEVILNLSHGANKYQQECNFQNLLLLSNAFLFFVHPLFLFWKKLRLQDFSLLPRDLSLPPIQLLPY